MTEYSKNSDEKLMIACTQGDQKAFKELYQRYAQKLFGYFYKMLNDHSKAEDQLQEVFTKVIEKGHLFDANKSFSVWIFTIAANQVKNAVEA